MTDVTIYHNPRCTKSRQTLKLLEERGLEHTVVEYLKDPPTAETLRSIVKALEIEPQDLLRKKEQIFKEVCSDGNPTGDEAIQLMVDHPKLIERPVVVVGGKAAVGRPPENVLPLLPAD